MCQTLSKQALELLPYRPTVGAGEGAAACEPAKAQGLYVLRASAVTGVTRSVRFVGEAAAEWALCWRRVSTGTVALLGRA